MPRLVLFDLNTSFDWKFLLAALLLITMQALSPGAQSKERVLSDRVTENSFSSDPNRDDLFNNDKKILLECIKIIRFNVKFHEEANRRWWWRDWLYPLEKEASTGLTFANSVVDIRQRSRGLQNTDLISKVAQKKGLDCAITGHALGGMASTLELAQNGLVVLRARKNHFSPKQSVAFVKSGVDIIDKLLIDRERILALDVSSDQYQVRVLQGRLLKHIRNQVVFEFTQWSVNSREVEWRENTFYAIDALQNFTSMGSSITSLHNLTASNLGEEAAVSSLVAHSLETLNPLIRTFAGACIGKYQRWHLSKVFPQDKPRTMKQLLNDWTELDSLISSSKLSNDESLRELAFLVRKSQNFDGPLDDEVKSIEHLRRVADQQAISGPLIGLTKVAESSCDLVAENGYASDVSNRIKLAGKISDASGQGYSLLATPTAKALHYRYTKRLSRQGKLPSQIMHERLIKLDQLEAKIEAARP
ncbi:hypothetical protein BH10CYA1_BH10CYA1_54270 [soil metagenome]